MTTFRADECVVEPWTVMITSVDGARRAIGIGAIEDEALYRALRELGVVS